MTTFAAILFDLDGTLCRHEQDAETIYFGAFRRAGVDPFGRPDDLWAALDGPPPVGDEEAYLASGFDAVASQHGVQTVDGEALARGFVATVDNRAVSFRDGATDALARARDHGHVGLVTNGPEYRQAVKLDALGIVDSFDAVVYAGDLPRRKPHSEPFDRALSMLGVEASTALYVGNSLEYDVAGAKAAGLQAAWYPDGDDRDPGAYEPDYVLDTLHNLAAILDGVD